MHSVGVFVVKKKKRTDKKMGKKRRLAELAWKKIKNATVVLMELGDKKCWEKNKKTQPVIRCGGPFLKVIFISLEKSNMLHY